MIEKQTQETPKSSAYRERNSTADKALDILGLFTPERLTVSAAEVAKELSVARSTAYRYLLTLGSAGYLEENPSGGFRLGLKVFELARLARASYGLTQLALPPMHVLAQGTEETVLLTRRSGNRVVCLEKEEPTDHRMRVSYERGSAMPLNAGASAWVLLAWEDPESVARLLAENRLEKFTDSTVVNANKVQDRLADIRTQGYAISRGELDPDAIGIAAPIWDDQNRVVAGLSVVAAARRVPESRVQELVEDLRKCADQISDLLALTLQ